jgi:hypothetical protein
MYFYFPMTDAPMHAANNNGGQTLRVCSFFFFLLDAYLVNCVGF